MSSGEYVIDGETVETKLEKTPEGFAVTTGDKTFNVLPLGNGLYVTSVNGRKITVAAAINKGSTYVDIDSVVVEVKEASDEFAGGAGDALGEKDKIMAPMPGKIVAIKVKVGDRVEPKQQVVIVEAMKMENPVLAKASGTVKAVNFAPGDQVDTDSPIVELELDEEAE
jgi:biotin carboxyl carrier protein